MELVIAALTGASAVLLGAFGAHGLRGRVAPDALATWNTAAHYHLVHAVLLVALALHGAASGRSVRVSMLLVGAGVLLFSGSLYSMVLTGVRVLGAITPVGGLLLVGGWLSLLWLRRA